MDSRPACALSDEVVTKARTKATREIDELLPEEGTSCEFFHRLFALLQLQLNNRMFMLRLRYRS